MRKQNKSSHWEEAQWEQKEEGLSMRRVIPRCRWGKGAISDDCARIYIKGCGADDAGDAA